MQVQSPSALGHLADATGSTFRAVGHLGFAASHLVTTTCNVVTIPFSPYFGTVNAAGSLGQAITSTASALKEAGSVVVSTASAVVGVATILIPGT